MGVMERKEREKEMRRQQIINAGESLFVKKGLNGTSMEDIANVCEISRGTLYLYFKSKEDLYMTVLTNGLNMLYNMMKTNVDNEESIEKKLNSIGTAYLGFYKNYRNYFKLLNQMTDHEPQEECEKEVHNPVFEKSQKIWELIVNVINEGKEQKYIKESTVPIEIAIMLWSTSNGIIQIFDHLIISHCSDFPHNFGITKEGDNMQLDSSSLGLEKMLQKLWAAIMVSIRNKQ